MAPSECHGSNYKWDNRIFTPSFNREGEVASIPLPQREEQRQAFSKERGAGKQGGTNNLQSRGKVRQVHPASKWDSVSGQVPHSQQDKKSVRRRKKKAVTTKVSEPIEIAKDDAQEEQVHRKCSVKGCGFETVKTVPEIARLLLGIHYKLAREQLLSCQQQNAHNHEQEDEIVLRCTECQYTTECRSLWVANSILNSNFNNYYVHGWH